MISTPQPGSLAQYPSAGNAAQCFIDWMCRTALPLWADRRQNALLPFAERLTWEGLPDRSGFVRLRVVARQVAVYAKAAELGIDWAGPVAEAGWSMLSRYYWSATSGWRARVDDMGRAVDREFSFYDQAFAIYACVNWARLSGSVVALEMACATLRLIDGRLRDSAGSGWRSATDRPGFDQNSHMHFLEALLALYAVRPAESVGLLIEEVLALLKNRLLDADAGAIVEWFEADWRVCDRDDQVEPGHQYEWVWLLARAREQGFVVDLDARSLYGFAQTHGWCPSNGLIVDHCRRDGVRIGAKYRLWPHCEAIRAATTLDDAAAGRRAINAIVDRMFDAFLDQPFAGGWIDRLDRRLRAAVATVPASSLYHLWEAGQALVERGWAAIPRSS